MKKAVSIILAAMIMILGVSAFAAEQRLKADEAKKMALDYVGVTEDQANFTKVYLDWDNGRLVYEIEFYVGTVEYDMDVDAVTGMVTDFSRENHGGFGGFDHDWNDPYDNDWDDWFDWD